MNRVMKVTVNWKPQSTPELIQRLYDIVDFQFINLRSALHSTGEYELTYNYKMYDVADMDWRTKNQEEQDKLFKNFLKNSKKRTINNVSSSNGLYNVPNKAQKIARKPGQVKRSRSEKTNNNFFLITIYFYKSLPCGITTGSIRVYSVASN
jgi:hypothetical protein